MRRHIALRRMLGRGILIALLGLGLVVVGLQQPAFADKWTRVGGGGVDGKYRVGAGTDAITVFNSKLHVGVDGPFGARVIAYDGTRWAQENEGGFGDVNNSTVTAMAVYGSKLYVGTVNETDGAQIWSYDGTTWSRESAPNDSKVRGVSAMAVFNGALYAGTESSNLPCEVWRFDGTDWTRVVTDGFGDTANVEIDAMTVYGGKLLVGISNGTTGCQLWGFDGSNWAAAAENGFGDSTQDEFGSMGIYNGKLYAASSSPPGSTGGLMTIFIWEYDGANWTLNFSHESVGIVSAMAPFQSCLFASVFDSNYGCQTLRYDGTEWVSVAEAGFGEGGVNVYSRAMATFQSSLFVTTINAQDGTQVWRTAGVGGPPFTDWRKVNQDGFSSNHNIGVSALALYGGNTYAMTQNPHSGAELWRRDGNSWTQVEKNGFGLKKANVAISATAILDSTLYMGTYGNYNGPATLWKFDGTTLTAIDKEGFGELGNRNVPAMVAYDSKLYLATDVSGGGRIYRYDGDDTFVQINQSGFGDKLTTITSMIVYNSLLYVGTDNGYWGAELWTYDGAEWSRVIGAGFANTKNTSISSMAVIGNILYLGTTNSTQGCEVWRYKPRPRENETRWMKIAEGGFGNSLNAVAATLAELDGRLYVGTRINTTGAKDPSEYGCEVWSYNPRNGRWMKENRKGFANPYNTAILSMVSDGSNLVAGTGNSAYGGMVWETSGN